MMRHDAAEELADCELRIRDLEAQQSEMQSKISGVQRRKEASLVALQDQSAQAADIQRTLDYRKLQRTQEVVRKDLDAKAESLKQITGDTSGDLEREYGDLQTALREANNALHAVKGRCAATEASLRDQKRELRDDRYANIDAQYRRALVDLKAAEDVNMHLDRYYIAYDQAVMAFHRRKMEEINKTLRELWRAVYRSADIDYIEIKSSGEDPPQNPSSKRGAQASWSDDEGSDDSDFGGRPKKPPAKKRATTSRAKPQATAATAKTVGKSYNYRVVMHRSGMDGNGIPNHTELDMRGRCSAGQKVLACLLIRMALAETFCSKCGILTLDEPTTNLDAENSESLAESLVSLMQARQKLGESNFQLVVITHDEHWVGLLGQKQLADHYWRVSKDDEGYSQIKRQTI